MSSTEQVELERLCLGRTAKDAASAILTAGFTKAKGIDPEKIAVVNGWIVEMVDKCTCGLGRWGYPHETHCGYEPIVRVSEREQ